MIAVLTGDIVGSTHQDKSKWLPALKSALMHWGEESQDWEIYRGDEFQLRLNLATQALTAAFSIKACLKALAETDVRIAIGLGAKDHHAKQGTAAPSNGKLVAPSTPITQSNGQAFILSGRKLDEIKNKRIHLAVASDNATWDREWNLILQWALLSADNWSTGSAEIVALALSNPTLSQTEMAMQLKVAQSAISQRIKRSGFDLLQQTLELFKEKLASLCSS